jgi:hypothetical protein
MSDAQKYIQLSKPNGLAYANNDVVSIRDSVRAISIQSVIDNLQLYNDGLYPINDNFPLELWESRYNIIPEPLQTVEERTELIKQKIDYSNNLSNRLALDFIQLQIEQAGFIGVTASYNPSGSVGDSLIHGNNITTNEDYTIGADAYNSFILEGSLTSQDQYTKLMLLVMSLKPLEVCVIDRLILQSILAVNPTTALWLGGTSVLAIAQTDYVPQGDGKYSGGFGTELQPYLISTLEDLRKLSEDANPIGGIVGYIGDWINTEFALVGNINALATSTWNGGLGFSPIGTIANKFDNSIFDGRGYSVIGLKINRPTSSYIGMFGYTLDSPIVRTNIIDCDIIGDDRVGGLVGSWDGALVSKCKASGIVSGFERVGGMFGLCEHGTISDCYADVDVSGDNFVGGFTGVQATIHDTLNSYSVGAVISAGSFVGGFVGFKSGTLSTIASCYYDSDISGRADTNGGSQPKTTAEMKQQATFIGWNFTPGTGIWAIDENVTRPYFL